MVWIMLLLVLNHPTGWNGPCMAFVTVDLRCRCGPCKLMYPQLVAMKGELEGQVCAQPGIESVHGYA